MFHYVSGTQAAKKQASYKLY